MKLSDIQNFGLVQTLNELCGTTVKTYSFRAKIANLNEGLDWYLGLAFEAGRNWEFDDINETSPPIDEQNIVSGTNRYKLSDFTEKILNLVKLEILNADGDGLGLVPETLDSFGNVIGNVSGRINNVSSGSFKDLYIDAPSGIPTHYLKYGDFIYLRPNPDYSETDGLQAYFNRPALKFQFISCQPEADDELITATAHGLVANDTVIFESVGTISGGITADTQYYVIASGLTANVFKVSATLGGSSINITSDGTGMYFLKTSGEPGIVSTHHPILARKAASIFMGFNNTKGVYNSRLSTVLPQLIKDEQTIKDYFAGRDKDKRKRLMPRQEDNR